MSKCCESYFMQGMEEWVRAQNQQAHALHRAADYTQAEATYRAALPWANLRQRATLLNNLAVLCRDTGRFREALPMQEQALRIRRELLGDTHAETLIALNNLGSLLGAMGEWRKAGEMLRPLLKHPEHLTADALVNIALVEKMQGHYADAVMHLKQALPLASDRTLATVENNLGLTLIAIGKRKQARQHIEQALAALPTGHPMWRKIRLSLASLELAEHHYREARAHAEAAGKDGEVMLAWIDYADGQWQQAESRVATIDSERVDVLELRARLALKRKQEDTAIELLERAQRVGAEQPSQLHGCLELYAAIMRRRKQYAEAARAEQSMITLETRSAIAGASYR
jgi:tetratricopeptide (TPR) repeat protein